MKNFMFGVVSAIAVFEGIIIFHFAAYCMLKKEEMKNND